VPFDAGGLEILLQGRIDRIDLDDARTRFRVIDYKTGKTRVKAPPDMGRALQLPLYLHAAAQLLDLPVEQGEAQYFYCTSRGEFWRSTFRGDDLVERRDEMDRVLRTIAEGVDRGYFAPNPGKGADNCRFCEYKFVCNAGIDRIMEGKQTDGPAAAYIALQDIT
jgi:RecB family exonuclease